MNDTLDKVLIVVGASHAGSNLALTARRQGWQGEILLLGEEPHLPYHRPPLSKDYLAGNRAQQDILLRPETAYEKAEVVFRPGSRVISVERGNRQVVLADGTSLSYDKLALCLGSRARTVPIPGADREGVHYLRTVDDVESIRSHIQAGKSAVIVGGGYIGLEAAATLRKAEMEVTVLEMLPRVLQRVTAPEVSEFFTRVHVEQGVNIVNGATVETIEGENSVSAVLCADGSAHAADLVIIGVGIVPNTELAGEAGLKIENGIVVDEYARTSDPDIVAAGDCTFHHNRQYDTQLRLESVQNAMDQSRVAATTVSGTLSPYDALPWFWSDQYELKLQIAGLSQGYDDVVIRGDSRAGRRFAAFYFNGEQLIAVDAVNMPDAFAVTKRLLATGKAVDRKKLADESAALKDLL